MTTCDQLVGIEHALQCAFSKWSPDTLGRDFVLNLAAGILTTALIAYGASRWYVLRWYITGERRAFRRMFGRGAGRDGAVIVVLDTFVDGRLMPAHVQQALNIPAGPPAQFAKLFPDNHGTSFPLGDQPMLAYASARAAGYVVNSVASVPGISVQTMTDEEVAARWKATFVCIGNSYTNIKTDDLKLSKSNEWLEDDGGRPRLAFKDGTEVTPNQRQNVAYIMKLWNPHSPDLACIVCGGLGPWGTSGAAWFFGQHWRALSRRFRKNPFLIVLGITPGSDQAVTEIKAYGKQSARRRVRAWFWARLGRRSPCE